MLFIITCIYEINTIQKVETDAINRIIIYIIFVFLCLIAISFTIYLYNNKNIKPEKAFLIIVPLFCILLSLAMPMSKGHDETIHGLRIYEYAEGKFISNGEKAYLEEGVTNALDDKPRYKNIFNNKNTYDTNTPEIEYGYRIASYSPITYLPQIIGVVVGRTITTNSMIHIYLARFANIVTCMIMLYFCIKIIPFGKNMMFLLCLIPIAIEGFSTLSADGMTISACFLWIAYILKLREEKDKIINKKDIIILSILAVIVALSKTIYITLLPLLFLIPKQKFKNNKTKITFITTTIILSSAIDIIWYIMGIQKESLPVEIGDSALNYIISNPFGYIQKLLYTIVINLGKYIQEMFGHKLEWNEAVTIPIFPTVILIISLIISKLGKKELKWKRGEKLLISFIIIFSIISIFTAMFISWSDTNISYIDGIQGRYFLPIVPLIFLVLGRNFLDDIKTTKIISVIGVIMQICVITQLVLYHI